MKNKCQKDVEPFYMCCCQCTHHATTQDGNWYCCCCHPILFPSFEHRCGCEAFCEKGEDDKED